MTLPSSTIANWFSGLVCVARYFVASEKSSAPSVLKSSVTTQFSWFVGTPACALVTRLPSISVGPRRNFCWPGLREVVAQARHEGLVGNVREGVAARVRAVVLGVGLRRHPGQLRGQQLLAGRVLRRERRCHGGGPCAAQDRYGRQRCGLVGGGSVGRRVRGVDRTELELSRLTDELDELVLLHVRHRDLDLVAARGGDLGLADAERVDALLDDRPGQVQAVLVDRSRA